MKKNFLIILFLYICATVVAHSDPPQILQSVQDNAAPKRESPSIFENQNLPETVFQQKTYPVDTQAALKLLDFKKISYDSMFLHQDIVVGSEVISSTREMNREIILPVIFLLMLAYVTWLRFVFSKELSENITVISNSNLGQQIYRDREYSANIFKLLTFLNFTGIGGIFIYLLIQYFKIPLPFENNAINIAACVALILVLYLIKGIIYNIIGAGFRIGNVFSFFRFNSLVIYHLLGICMLPLVILAAFAEEPVKRWALFANLGLIGLAMVIRIFKGFSVIRMAGRFHIVYFLLYICALEIAPLLIAVKLFSLW